MEQSRPKPIRRAILAIATSCTIFLILFVTCALESMAQIKVGIQPNKEVQQVLIAPVKGDFVLIDDRNDTLYRFRSDDAVSVRHVNGKLIVKSPFGLNDTLESALIAGWGKGHSFQLRLNEEPQKLMYYGSLQIEPRQGALHMVNAVELEHYVSRVVQAEVGHGANEEYYKIQSIICRTYVVRNLERHVLDGYDVCDHQHCQVYSGTIAPSDEVIRATAATAALVLTSKEGDLILSAFHSNCGGQTANSEDVWKEPRSYLQSVTDTFCLHARSAVWEKTFDADAFFAQLGWEPKTADSIWQWEPDEREPYFQLGTDSISTVKMRRLLGLRSAFFQAFGNNNGQIVLKGRGYGHGVGLCQQGAMKMAEHGYTYSQILGYYYKGAHLTPVSQLSDPQ